MPSQCIKTILPAISAGCHHELTEPKISGIRSSKGDRARFLILYIEITKQGVQPAKEVGEMPKATKKKKEKHADFTVSGPDRALASQLTPEQKAKLKLGKGKKQPSNATDTSFKARST